MNLKDYVPDTELLLWVGGPCVVCFALIWILTCCSPQKHSPDTQRQKKRVLVRKDSGLPFFDRTGLLDGGTPYLKSASTAIKSYNFERNGYSEFDRSNSALQQSVFRGWYNIVMLLIVSYIALIFISNYAIYGTLISNTHFLWSLVLIIHELIIAILFVYFASFAAYFTQHFAALASDALLQVMGAQACNQTSTKYKKSDVRALISKTSRCRFLFTATSYLCITFVFVLTTLFVFHSTKHWPWSQKLALMLETVALTLKAHSYTDTNNELFAVKLKEFQRSFGDADKPDPANKLPDITHIADVDSLTDSEIESYLLAYGVKKNLLFTSAKEAQKKYLTKIRDQLVLRNTIYPRNVTLWDFLLFSCTPTLCYSPIYPRSNQTAMDSESANLWDNIEWVYVLEKFIMGLGIMVCMYLIAETFVIPVLLRSTEMAYADAVIRLYFPFFCLFILGFVLTFDCILNASAELTCFADRKFYGDWWNATSFMEFSRKWNRPVHEYLLRHIYLGVLIKQCKCSPFVAKSLTFIWSNIFHEVVLTAITHKFRPWFMFFALWQIPLIPVMQSPMFRNTQLGNITTLCPVILGSVMIALLYARHYDINSCM